MSAARSLLSDPERDVVEGFRVLADGNPFLPERIDGERAILGKKFVSTSVVWHVDGLAEGLNPNLDAIVAAAERLADTLRERLSAGARGRRAELVGYEALVRYLCYSRYQDDFYELIDDEMEGRSSTRPVPSFERFAADLHHYLEIPGVELPHPVDAAHAFAWGYQIRRAFQFIYRNIFGGSMPAARLRADVWNSVFTCDVDLYRRVLFERMGDVPTLIVGESGTGKELVALAVGLSRYIPFDVNRRCFVSACRPSFHAVNLSALASSLIESELFGHRRGSFTGAIEDRVGWFETCTREGSIFLDEIGELDAAIQVKLLRVLQGRSFERIGETESRRFEGKIIAATNRDLYEEMEQGGFRRDLYYRICADVIRTPSLAAQISDAPDELYNLVLILARRIVGNEAADALSQRVVDWVAKSLGYEYPWPGNVRELEQCVRNIMIRRSYEPASLAHARPPGLPPEALRGDWTVDELLRVYVTRVYHQAGSYEEAARRLGLDRRTVKAKVDAELLAELEAAAG